MSAIPDDLVALRAVAGKLGVSVRELVEMSERGEFVPVYAIGRKQRVSESAASRWLEGRRVDELKRRRAIADRIVRTGRAS